MKEVEEKKRIKKEKSDLVDTIAKRVAENYQNISTINTFESMDREFDFAEIIEGLPPLKEESVEINPFIFAPPKLIHEKMPPTPTGE